MDISNLCRSCIKTLKIGEAENFDKNLIEMFVFCTNIQVAQDEFPTKFCKKCQLKIKSAYVFIKSAQNVNETLKNLPQNEQLNCENIKIEKNTNDYDHTKKSNDDDNDIDTKCIEDDDEQLNKIVQFVIFKECKPEVTNTDEGSSEIPTENNMVNVQTLIEEHQNQSQDNTFPASLNIDLKCKICLKNFKSIAWYTKHIENEHKDGEKFKCPLCKKVCQSQKSLWNHKRSKHGVKKYVCSICNKKFTDRNNLNAHAVTHSDSRPFTCDFCHMKFKLKNTLKAHLVIHDENNKKNLCNVCGASFTHVRNLTEHMVKHTGERPYACDQCDFRAKYRTGLVRHVLRHAGTRPYACTHCTKAFYTSDQLRRHERAHTGERPYQCGRCPRTFADCWKRKTHLVRDHRLPFDRVPRLRVDGTPVNALDRV